jgi:hypothetical protein
MPGTALRLRLRPGTELGAPKLLSEGGKAGHDEFVERLCHTSNTEPAA